MKLDLRLLGLIVVVLLSVQPTFALQAGDDSSPRQQESNSSSDSDSAEELPKAESPPNRLDMCRASVERLIALQESDGAWPYEGVYRVRRKIPVGYRIGGTAIVSAALLHADLPERKAADEAIRKGVQLILAELENPLMKPTVDNKYDVRVWGHIFALDLFCRVGCARLVFL